MGIIDEKAKTVIKQLRYSWTFVSLVLLFILILWTFQLALIVRFQTFWPSSKTTSLIHQSGPVYDSVTYKHRVNSRIVLSHPDDTTDLLNRYNSNSSLKLICYYVLDYDNSTTDARKIKFHSSLESDLCTHIIIGFAVVINDTVVPGQPQDIQIYKQIVQLKTLNPSLKVLLSVQDIGDPLGFASAVSSEDRRKKFANSAIKVLVNYGFDGIDLDWEFPSWPTADDNQRRNFTFLIRDVREEIKRQNGSLLLSVAVGAPAAILLQCYEIAEMSRFIDFVNLMSYDYHIYTRVTPYTGPNSPLFQKPQETSFSATLNTNWSAYHWHFWGMPKEKIMVGVPSYGHSFMLLNEDNNGWGAPAGGVGRLGINGFTSYPNACKFTADPQTTHVFDDYYKVPYAFQNSEWLSYETPASINLKGNLIKDQGYGGGMLFSLNADDVYGECGYDKFMLTKTLKAALS